MVERFTVKGWNDEQIALAAEDGKWVLYEEHEDAVAALKAENERLEIAKREAIAGWKDAERALAERAGGVKVKALEWAKDNSVGGHGGWIGRAGDFTRAVKIGWMVEMPYEFGDQAFATLDDAKAAAQADYERRILSTLTTEPAAPEGRQEAMRIGDAVLEWMVKFDLLDGGNEYYVADVLAVLNDLTPPTRPAEQAVTEAMVGAAEEVFFKTDDHGEPSYDMRAALEAALEAAAPYPAEQAAMGDEHDG